MVNFIRVLESIKSQLENIELNNTTLKLKIQQMALVTDQT